MYYLFRCNLTFYVHVTTDKRLVLYSKVFIQLNYKGIPTVYNWRIGDAY